MGTRSAGALSGALAALALPPFGLWPLAFSALVPLVVVLSRPGLSRGDVVASGIWFGGLFYGLLLHWVPFTLQGLLPLGFVVGLMVLAILAGLGGFQALLLRRLTVAGVLPVLAVPAVWVGAEFLLEHAGPFAFPWTPIGLSLTAAPSWAGPAEWVGVRGLSFWLCAVNGAVAGLLIGRPRAGRKSTTWATVLLILLPGVAGMVRERSLATRRLPSILLGQMYVDRDDLLRGDRRDSITAESLHRIAESARAGLAFERAREVAATDSVRNAVDSPRILVLPEAPFSARWEDGVGDLVASETGGFGLPVLVGAKTRDLDVSPTSASPRNAAILVTTGGGARVVHAKARLVPGVESPGLTPGPRGGVLHVDAADLGVVICFESAFGGEVRRLRRQGADLLVNMTNDGWFAPKLIGLPAAAHAQHRAHLVMRTIETRMGAMRASLGGEALVVAPTGHVLLARPAGTEGVATARPVTSSVETVYTRYGDVGGLAGLSLLATLVVLTWWRRPVEQAPGGRYT